MQTLPNYDPQSLHGHGNPVLYVHCRCDHPFRLLDPGEPRSQLTGPAGSETACNRNARVCMHDTDQRGSRVD
jgi:hypothetical protein